MWAIHVSFKSCDVVIPSHEYHCNASFQWSTDLFRTDQMIDHLKIKVNQQEAMKQKEESGSTNWTTFPIYFSKYSHLGGRRHRVGRTHPVFTGRQWAWRSRHFIINTFRVLPVVPNCAKRKANTREKEGNGLSEYRKTVMECSKTPNRKETLSNGR